MTNSRRDGLYLLLLGCVVFLALGTVLAVGAPHPVSDYRFVYNSARCLFQNVDPYNVRDFQRVFLADGGDLGSGLFRNQYSEMSQYMYLPTSFIVAPLALLPWGLALTFWSILIAIIFILASFLMWRAGADHSPVVSGFLIGLVLASSELLLIVANPVGIVVGLCIIAAWCFVEDRFAFAGVAYLAVSLMLKPHDAGLVWLYFLLAGGIYRRRALQTLLVTFGLSVPILAWVTYVSPHWLRELRSNLQILSAHGHLNDPGPSSMAGHGIAMVIDLQSVISLFKDDPRVYNPISYFICGLLLVIWAIATVRSRPSPVKIWLALAAIAPLTMLPVYHRLGDAKLLLLTVPACAVLWAEGGLIAWLAVALSLAGFLVTGELQWAAFFGLLKSVHISANWLSGPLLIGLQVFPVPLTLFVLSAFYLSVYLKRTSEPVLHSNSEISIGTNIKPE
jgi:hypothetical protein